MDDSAYEQWLQSVPIDAVLDLQRRCDSSRGDRAALKDFQAGMQWLESTMRELIARRTWSNS